MIKVTLRTLRYREVPVSMRQTLGKMTSRPLVNPSKFCCDGKTVNTIHCFKAILKEKEDYTDPNCQGSHVPPIREVFDFILSLKAEDHFHNGYVDDLDRTFLFNVLKIYFRKHFRHNTLPVITRPRSGKQLNAYLRDLQYRFRVKCTAQSNMYQGTIIKDILAETEWLKQIENKLPPQSALPPCVAGGQPTDYFNNCPDLWRIKRMRIDYREVWAAYIQHPY
ncbi:hypothetical protein J4E80_002893 [Alternaria sp. BMP 0032]|nr:hypothetical protein J4E80_002893 [Alternaria sp. BMP 0032]